MDAEGACIGFCGIIRDVSERKGAEEALKESKEQFEDLVEQ